MKSLQEGSGRFLTIRKVYRSANSVEKGVSHSEDFITHITYNLIVPLSMIVQSVGHIASIALLCPLLQ